MVFNFFASSNIRCISLNLWESSKNMKLAYFILSKQNPELENRLFVKWDLKCILNWYLLKYDAGLSTDVESEKIGRFQRSERNDEKIACK